jgi:uncharacterized membrane protein (DUF2068 family)
MVPDPLCRTRRKVIPLGPHHDTSSPRRQDRLLPWIAAERTVRSIVLIAVGIALLTHTHTHWGGWFNHLARSLGFDPGDNTLGRITGTLNHLTPSKIRTYGLIALGYGVLEAAEAYGLWRRRRWGEYLTIVATALLLIPEVDEIVKKPSVLKALGLVLNLAIVAYLITRLRRRAD